MIDTAEWWRRPAKAPDARAARAAAARQAKLVKPHGALGRLEEIVVRLAALQGNEQPRLHEVRVVVFVADHGVAAESVSAYPQSVTVEMLRTFARGGAAICVLARELGVTLELVELGTATDPGRLARVKSVRLGAGTGNLCQEPAMDGEQLARALAAGRQAAAQSAFAGAQLFIGGEMGIANTTASAALASALLHAPPEELAGPGTGLDVAGVAHKVEVIRRALELHAKHLGEPPDPLEALRRLGGFEIAALAGSYVAAAQLGLPLLVDGFISSVAALVASRLCEGASSWFLFSHTSAEPGHAQVLEALRARPLLDLGLRLGEGSGAAVALPLLRLACALHAGMATFEEAGVSSSK